MTFSCIADRTSEDERLHATLSEYVAQADSAVHSSG